MSTEVNMPRLSEAMEQGTVLRWLVAVGDPVRPGTALVEIETDKATTTYEAEAEGVLVERIASEGDTVAVGEPIARMGPVADGAAEPPPAPEPVAAPPAGEAGVKGEPEVVELTRQQRTASRRMAESRATVPDFSLEVEVDMTLCAELRTRLEASAGEGPAPSYDDMVVKATALAAREHPRVNGAYRDGAVELYPAVNVGVAVPASQAPVVPVVRGADEKSLGEIARQVADLTARAHEGSLTSPELAGATITVSSLAPFGIDRFTAVVNAPQAAILAVGAVAPRPGVDDRGRVVARESVFITMASDHRILQTADAAAFLARLRLLLEQPLALAL